MKFDDPWSWMQPYDICCFGEVIQDKTAIAHGKLWEAEIKSAIAESVFFIPIVTPTAVRSHHCKFEFDSFLAREKELGRSDLVFPILYIPVPALIGDRWRQDPFVVDYR